MNYTSGMFTGSCPVTMYYVPCREKGCWVLLKTNGHVPSSTTCRLHNHDLAIRVLVEGYVTQFEANQGWTKQKPDQNPIFSYSVSG